MRKVVLSLVVTALLAATVQAVPTGPSLGPWNEGAIGSTHQSWDFTPGFVSQIPGFPTPGLEALPESLINPNPTGIKLQISPGATWDGQTLISGSTLMVDAKINNYPQPNAFKEVWVDYTLVAGTLAGVTVVAGDGNFKYEAVPTRDGADFGFRIYPNPSWENLQFVFAGVGTAPAILDGIHIDTICVPAPGAVLLTGLGAGLVGWLRRRRAL